MINNLETLHKYYEEGWLIKQTHPTLPLTIWNYSQTTQYEGKWDEVTMMCRGLITDNNTGKILVRPFKKFFNYEEVVGKGVIPTKGDYVYIQEKMDGSLGILFCYEGEWVMATRGSFTSDQAIKGLEIVKSKYTLDSFSPEFAYLVEILYKENRIVVDYGDEDRVVFLSVVLNEVFPRWHPIDDSELHWTTAQMILKRNGVTETDIVKTEQHFSFSDSLYKQLKAQNETNKEGFVLRFFPGNFRMKIKFEDYVRLHKVMTNLSTTAIWEVLSSGGTMDTLLADVPDEFYTTIKEYEMSLVSKFIQIRDDVISECARIAVRISDDDRKVFAELAKKYQYPGLLFALYDKKSIESIIWKLIKPEFKKL